MTSRPGPASAVARHLVIHGRVQGVGYRDATVAAALDHGVTGWVRNRRDGTVEAHAQGDVEVIERFIAWCRQGPPLARVASIDVREAEHDPSHRGFARHPTA